MKVKTGQDAEKLHEKFFGHPSEKETVINLNQMRNLTLLGEAVAIEYYAEKHSDRKPHVYRHEFENPSRVYTNGKELIIHGHCIEITSHGIEG